MRLVTALGLATSVLCSACDRSDEGASAQQGARASAGADPHAAFTSYDCDQVEALLEKDQAVPVDVNSTDTRLKMGTLPGAILLSDTQDFTLAELPSDRGTPLVFYCGGKRCMSAPKAAERAKDAGYANVAVMREGIRGWVAAGKRVDPQS